MLKEQSQVLDSVNIFTNGKQLSSVQDKTADIIEAIEHLGYTVSMNMMDDGIYCNKLPLTAVRAEILSAMYDAGVKNTSRIETVVELMARRNPFHPIHSYLESLNWDGQQDHIAQLASYVKDSHEPIAYADGSQRKVFHAFLRRWLIGCVAKAYAQFNDSETPQNVTIVLAGKTGIGKSSFIKFLAGDMAAFFSDSSFDPDHDEIEWRLSKIWIWELGELSATTRRKDVDALKHRLTQARAQFRVPWGRGYSDKNTLASFMASSNPDGLGFLVDQTGNRRFASVDVEAIDFAYATDINMSKVWAQAVALYKAGESYKFVDEEITVKNENNTVHTKEQPIGAYVDMLFEIDPTQDWKTEPIIIGELLAKNYGQRKDVCAKDAAQYLTTTYGIGKSGKPLTWRGIRVRKELFGDRAITKPADVYGKDAVSGLADEIKRKIFENLQANYAEC